MVEYLSGGRLQGITASLDNLKAYYNFDESSGNLINQQTTGDGLGSNANGTASGDPTYGATGVVDDAIEFDGVGDKFTLGTTAGQWNFLHNGGDFTISWWQKLNATPDETQGVCGTGGGGSSIGFELRVKPDIGKLTALIENGSGATSSINSSNGFVPVNTTTWYNFVLTFSDGAWNIYRNGANNESNSSSITWSSSDHSRNMELANVNANTPTDVKDLTGLLDEMSIWNRVLTSAEISKLYDIGVADIALKDSSSDFLGSPPSNVPDGTRFEDVGTRKIFRRNDPIWIERGIASPTLKVWLDADDSSTITKDGSNKVSQWNDKSGQGNHVSQSTAGSQPLWVDSAQNSKPLIRFDGSDDSLFRNTYTGGAITQPATVFAVLKMGDTYYKMQMDSKDGSNRFAIASGNSSAITFVMYGGAELETLNHYTNMRQYTLTYNGASSVARQSKTAYMSGNAGTMSMIGLILGDDWNGSSNSECDWCELLIYEGTVADSVRDSIEDYLATKWGL